MRELRIEIVACMRGPDALMAPKIAEAMDELTRQPWFRDAAYHSGHRWQATNGVRFALHYENEQAWCARTR